MNKMTKKGTEEVNDYSCPQEEIFRLDFDIPEGVEDITSRCEKIGQYYVLAEEFPVYLLEEFFLLNRDKVRGRFIILEEGNLLIHEECVKGGSENFGFIHEEAMLGMRLENTQFGVAYNARLLEEGSRYVIPSANNALQSDFAFIRIGARGTSSIVGDICYSTGLSDGVKRTQLYLKNEKVLGVILVGIMYPWDNSILSHSSPSSSPTSTAENGKLLFIYYDFDGESAPIMKQQQTRKRKRSSSTCAESAALGEHAAAAEEQQGGGEEVMEMVKIPERVVSFGNHPLDDKDVQDICRLTGVPADKITGYMALTGQPVTTPCTADHPMKQHLPDYAVFTSLRANARSIEIEQMFKAAVEDNKCTEFSFNLYKVKMRILRGVEYEEELNELNDTNPVIPTVSQISHW